MATIRCLEQQFENIQAVLFDKDGTLANVDHYLRALGKARSHFINAQVPGLTDLLLVAFGITEKGIDPAGLMAVGSRYENEIAAATYIAATGKGWIDSLTIANAAFDKAEAALPQKVTQTPLLKGAKQLLQNLQASRVTLGIVSADSHSEVAAFIREYQLSEISGYCGTSANTPAKTHPDFLKFICKKMAIDPTATLVIGDSASDLQLALHGTAGFVEMTGGWQNPSYISPMGNHSIEGSANCVAAGFRVATIDQLDQVESFD